MSSNYPAGTVGHPAAPWNQKSAEDFGQFECDFCHKCFESANFEQDIYLDADGNRREVKRIGDKDACIACDLIHAYHECIRVSVLPQLEALSRHADLLQRFAGLDETITPWVLDMAIAWIKEEVDGKPTTFPPAKG